MGRSAFRYGRLQPPDPRYDSKIKLHRDLATAAERAESLAAVVPLPEGVKFQRARALVRSALMDAGISATIDALVARLLDGAEATHNIRAALSVLVNVGAIRRALGADGLERRMFEATGICCRRLGITLASPLPVPLPRLRRNHLRL